MAVDEVLLEAAVEGQCALRFYRWRQPTLSLGYFQAYSDRGQHPASSRCPVVRRASGGGAIVHDLELTYSVAVPAADPLATDHLRMYRALHECLIGALAQWGIKATMLHSPALRASVISAPSASNPPGHGEKCGRPFLCFQRYSPEDVLVGGVKVAGSAQRRRRGALLQHGSVLLARSDAAPELDGLKELTGKSILAEELIGAWLEELVGVRAVTCRQEELSEERCQRAAALAAEKYSSAAWTENRGRQAGFF